MKKHIILCGGTASFRGFLARVCKSALEAFDTPGEFPLQKYPPEETLYILLPRYEKGEKVLPFLDIFFLRDLLDCKKHGARLYMENYPCRDYLAREVFGCFTTGNIRSFYDETLVLADGNVLQAASSAYMPATQADPEKILLSIQNCTGLHKVIKEGTFSFPALIDDHAGAVSAMMALTDFDSLFMRPYARWKEFLSSLWANLLELEPEEVRYVFSRTFPPLLRTTEIPDEKEALQKALDWHTRSGLLYSPDGTKGAYEMIRSDDLLFRTNFRVDSILMTGALLASAGKFLRKETLYECGKNLGNFFLQTKAQTPEGFIHWYENQTTVFSNDLARHILSLHSLWESTSEESFLTSAKKAAEAAGKWLENGDGLCCGYFDTRKGYEGRYPHPSGVFHGELGAALLKLDPVRYAPAAEKILDQLDWDNIAIGHSKPDVWSRCFLLYACAHGTLRDCTKQINAFLDYYETLLDPCGGFREEDLYQRRSAPLEAGVAQGEGFDRIADFLYCNNYLFAILEILQRKMPRDLRIRSMYGKLKKFILQSQITSDDPRFHGAWMRAFDMESNEYYGLLMDRDWGPYCIMAGWTMGIIPLTLLADLGAKPFFDK